MRKHSIARRNYDDFVNGYVTAALWTSTDESDESGGEPMDANYGPNDIASSTMKKMKADCAKFMKANKALLSDYCHHIKRSTEQHGPHMSGAGHDFWLTRSGHGAGFWDRDYEDGRDDIGEKLTSACKKFGEVYLYVGDDGKIHQ